MFCMLPPSAVGLLEVAHACSLEGFRRLREGELVEVLEWPSNHLEPRPYKLLAALARRAFSKPAGTKPA